MIELFIKGGPIMWPLLAASFAALTTVIERALFLFREYKRRDPKGVNRILKLVEGGDIPSAIEAAKHCQDVIGRVLFYALTHREVSLESAVLRASSIELKRYTKGLSVLDTIITLAPLLGLLGTVTGMIAAFGLLGGGELDAPSAITGGIAEALLATAFGLGIAILSLLPFNYLNTALETLRQEIEEKATELELIVRSQATAPHRMNAAFLREHAA